nr:transposase [Puniceicoccus vermicola]
MKTKRFWRGQLPHWEVESGVYFFTIRCANTLPQSILIRLEEINSNISGIEPSSENFLQWQRIYFRTIEKYNDSGSGFCPFKTPECAKAIVTELRELSKRGWTVSEYVVMPNHLHLLVETHCGSAAMSQVWTQWKGRTAFHLNQILQRKGAFWQREFFDRVSRSESETERMVRYIRENPVKAGLPKMWLEDPWAGNLKDWDC